MGIVKEVIYTINFWSPPLNKHRYRMDSILRRARTPSRGGTGILLDEIEKRDRMQRQAPEGVPVYVETPSYSDPAISSVMPNAEFNDYNHENEPAEIKSGRRFRVLKKVETLIFDDTAEKIGQLEEEALKVLNADGFYDEILPLDCDEEIEEESGPPLKNILIIGGLTILLTFILIIYIKNMF